MVKLVITEDDEEYLRLIAKGAEVVSIQVEGEEVFYRKVTDNDKVTFYYLPPSSPEMSSFRGALSGNGITMRGWYPPEGVDDFA